MVPSILYIRFLRKGEALSQAEEQSGQEGNLSEAHGGYDLTEREIQKWKSKV